MALKKERERIWSSLARIISTVVSKAILDNNEEQKKPKVDRGGLAMRITNNAVRSIKECGLLHPSSPIEAAGVQEKVWKDVFPQTPFPHSSQAVSTPNNSMASQAS